MNRTRTHKKVSFYRLIFNTICFFDIILVFSSCRSMYGEHVNATYSDYTHRLTVQANHSFTWHWSFSYQLDYCYTKGTWKNEHDSLSRTIYHFKSDVTDIHQFPMRVKECTHSSAEDILFSIQNVTIPNLPNLIVELHINEKKYKLDSSIVHIEKQKIDSFSISIRHTMPKSNTRPYPCHRKVQTVTYFPKNESNTFDITLYNGIQDIDERMIKYPIVGYLYYIPLEFDGYYEVDEYTKEKVWVINPQRPIESYQSGNKLINFELLRKGKVIDWEYYFAL